jgi:hypothetical protein
MPLYDTRPYTVPVPREPGWYTVTCRVTWTPRGGESVTATGDYLDARYLGGAVALSCGLREALVALELTDWRWPDDHVRALCDEVDRQLLLAPTATLRCPMGVAVIELVPPTSKG